QRVAAAAPSRPSQRRHTGPESRVCALLFARASAKASGLPRVVAANGGTYQALADGEHSFLVTIESVRAPTDQAAAAARVSIALREADPEIRQVLVTGRGSDGGHTPMGELVDSAVRHLLSASAGEIRVDRLTAALIDARFHVTFDGNLARLAGERDAEGTRTLLGKPSLWVGRRRELATLLATLDECAEERVSRAVLVLAPAGIGKSRLRHEMVRSLERRGTPVLVLHGRGDSLSAGSPFVMIAPALRRAAGILDGEAIEVRRDKVAVLVESAVPAAERRRITELLGEMIGVPFPDEDSELLRSARADKMLLGQQMERAWVDWVRAECARQPVLLVLEDLHWGDLPSVNYIDAALRAIPDAPLMVLALARPEVRETFPRLWEHREVEEITLHALSPTACGELVRAALGAQATPELVEELVRRCDGNAFYLEELVRAVAEGGGAQSLPETVIGMVQARLAALDPQARRVLRAAAVFGEAFWDGGVRALLGSDEGEAFDPGEWLEDLVRREVIARAASSRLPDQREYTFRHALLRDGAYELLTEEDRQLGHALAGEWLVRAGEQDGLVLAGHFDRGGDSVRAVQWYRRAAQQALDGNDLAAVIERAERGITAGATGEALGELRGLQASAAYWSSRYADGRRWGQEAVATIHPGSASWFAALGSGLVSAARLGDYDTVDRMFARALGTERAEGAEAAQLVCLCRGGFQLIFAGRFARADEILVEIAALAEQAKGRLDPLTYAQVNHVQGVRAAHVGDVATFLRHLLAAVDGFERAGDTRNLSLERTTVAWCWAELGELARAEDECRASLETCRALRAQQATTYAHVNLGYILTYRPGKLAEASDHLRRAIDECRAVGNPRLEGWARAHLTAVHDLQGDHAAGLVEAQAATELLAVSPGLQSWALATWSRALLANGRAEEAVLRAREAMAILERLGGLLQHETLPPLALARALHGAGDVDAARAAIRDAHARLLRLADRLGDPAWRTSFLALPDHALTLELFAAWG
ncbi:MAG: AAA family ATPase, partial [Kofleriaceae bacterium]|nr:AAA family ATPase [Kofleriaceae bacterium]